MTFAFIDESGNTGANMFDLGQPMFFSAALVTKTDVDQDWSDRLKSLARTLGHSNLHASVVTPSEVGALSPHILSLLQEAESHVVLTGVHKKTHVAMKIFDYIFDPGENPGAPWHSYWMKPLRVMNALLFADLLRDADLRDGWESLMESREEKSRSRFHGLLKRLLPRTSEIEDPRQREIFNEALHHAVANPSCLAVHSSGKGLRYSHLPNLALFPELLAGIDFHSESLGSPAQVIRHDRNAQFDKYLRTLHQMMSEVEQYEMKLPFGVNLSLSRVPGSNFEVVASKDSAGVQVIDHILWVACRIINGHDVPSSCRDLFGYLEDTASNWFITREAMLNYWHGEMQKLYSLPYSKADENRAQEFLDKEKAKRHAKVNRANENP